MTIEADENRWGSLEVRSMSCGKLVCLVRVVLKVDIIPTATSREKPVSPLLKSTPSLLTVLHSLHASIPSLSTTSSPQ